MTVYAPKSKLVAPVATISDKLTIDGATSGAVLKDTVAVSGCVVYGVSIQSFDDITDEGTVQIQSDDVTQVEIMLVHTANQPLQTHFAFPAGIPIAGALSLEHGQDSDIDWYVHYVPIGA